MTKKLMILTSLELSKVVRSRFIVYRPTTLSAVLSNDILQINPPIGVLITFPKVPRDVNDVLQIHPHFYFMQTSLYLPGIFIFTASVFDLST